MFVGFLALACSILLIERLVRLTEILSGASNPAFDAIRLISRLLPHYFELALPAALLLTTILTINRLSRSGEIVAMLSSGVSLYRIARPFILISILLAGTSIFSSGYLKPLTRYEFRAVVFELTQNNIVAAFQDQRFVQFDNWTIWTDNIDTESLTLGEVFIFETTDTGSERFMSGSAGALKTTEEGNWLISLEDAMVAGLPRDMENSQANSARAGAMNFHLALGEAGFRNRGLDERELTIFELYNRSYEGSEFSVDTAVATADFHDRIVRAGVLIPLVLIGVYLGLNLGRTARSSGLVTGVVMLLVMQKVLEFGLLKAQQSVIPAWAGSWPAFLMFVIVALYLFNRANGTKVRSVSVNFQWPTFFLRPLSKSRN